MAYDAHGDLCLGFFQELYSDALMPLPQGASVLEIGCAEADWMTPMLAVRPDLQITGIDVRHAKRPGTIVEGDVLTQVFPPASFDAVVSVSAIEHIGLGAYGDPVDPEGDMKAMARIEEWVKPGGWVYFDVPFRDGDYEVHGSYRAYNWDMLAKRLLWPNTLRGVCARVFRDVGGADGPYIACLLKKV